MAATLDTLRTEVRANIGRTTGQIADSRVTQAINWSLELIAGLHSFEEMQKRIHNPVLDACESAWDAQASVTCALESTIIKRGTYSAKNTIAVAHTTGLAATNVITSVDLADYTHFKFWIRADVANAAGGLQFMCDDHATCASPTETIDIGALTVDTWSEQELILASPSSNPAVISLGLNVVTDVGAQIVYLDDVRVVRMTEKDVKDYSFPTRMKDIVDITLQDGSLSRPLIYVYYRDFDRIIPRPRETTSDTPTHYVDYGDRFELWPIPNGTYALHIRYTRYPTVLVDAVDDAVAVDLVRKDQLIAAAATATLFDSLRQYEDASFWWKKSFGQSTYPLKKKRLAGLMGAAMESDHSAEDWTPVARPFSTLSARPYMGASAYKYPFLSLGRR